MKNWRTTQQKGAIGAGMAAIVTGLLLVMTLPALAQSITPPNVPLNLQVPAGNTPFRVGHAMGNQNYVCTSSGAWTLNGPDATLFDDKGNEITTHLLSNNPFENPTPPPPGSTWNPALGGNPRPTWQDSRDTSTIWVNNTLTPTGPAQKSTDPNFVAPGAISWLLLPVVCITGFPCGGA